MATNTNASDAGQDIARHLEKGMKRNTYLELKPVGEARDLWFSAIEKNGFALGEEEVALPHARGRVTSRIVQANLSSPPFHAAAMDGIAVQAEETFGASAMHPLDLEVGRQAFWINTGQRLPSGCNAVIMIENLVAAPSGKSVRIERAAFPWQHVRKLGEDMVSSEILLAPGTRIGPYEMGALAAARVLTVPVCKKPVVAIIPSGSEIVPLMQASEDALVEGKCWPEFNSLIFASLVEEAGATAIVRDIVPDDPDIIQAAVRAALEDGADIVLLNAGSSAGSRDYTSHVIASLGEVFVHGVAVMPGKPAVLGLVDGHPVLGAPGYPVSATIVVEEFLLPLLARLQHTLAPSRPEATARLCQALPSRPGMEERIRVKLGDVDGTLMAVPLARGAGTVTSLSRADGMLTIPAACEGLDAGSVVNVSLLRSRERIRSALLAIGSHDNTLDLLDSLVRRRTSLGCSLTSVHVGSLGGLRAIEQGQCHLAGSHLLNMEDGVYNRKAIQDNLSVPVVLLRLVDRVQGFMVRPGNPLNIRGIQDLVREDITFINRQRGSGTRVLLDCLLKKEGLKARDIRGYTAEEFTHMNVAAAVLSGRADVGLGVLASARALGLDFIPVGVEEYDLVIPRKFWNDERMQAIVATIRSPEFKKQVEEMGGYGVEKTGEIVWEYEGRDRSE